MPWMLEQPQWQTREPFVRFRAALPAALCDGIIGWALQGDRLRDATTGTGDLNQRHRRSKVAWLRWDEPGLGAEVHQRLAAICQDARANWYPFHLAGFVEPIQVTRYSWEDRGHYDWHCDLGPHDQSARKLSMVALLNGPDNFTGGQLEIMSVFNDDGDRAVQDFQQGEVLVFPAWEQHRVAPVVSGVRWSLVAWVHGHPFT